jgi:hypothetical protein
MMIRIWCWIPLLCSITAIGVAQESTNTFFPDPVTDPGRYNAEYAPALSQTPSGQHFPDTIPPNATEVLFFYTPKNLQGAEIIGLSYILPLEDIQAEIATLSKKAKRVIEITEKDYQSHPKLIWEKLDDSTDTVYESPDTLEYHLNNSDLNDLEFPLPPFVGDLAEVPQQATIIYLDAKNTSGAEWWNHGYTYGILIRHNQRILYWAMRW